MNKCTELLTSLWFAYQKCVGMPREKQKEFMQFYLSLLLSDWSSEQISQLVNFVKDRSDREEITVFKSNSGNDNKIRKDNGRKRKIPETNSGSILSGVNDLSRFDELYEINDRAMDKAVKKSFSRILNALAPETVKSGIGIKEKLSFSCRSSVYAAYKDKYQRLKLYYEKGRLLRDYRASFKKYLNEELTSAGEI